jgi:KipI family sensor histidine kinase inhibitor
VETAAEIVRIASAGDSALVIEFPQTIAPSINARAITLADAMRRRCGSAVRDAVVGYASLTVYFDPLVVDASWMEAEIRDIAGIADESAAPRGKVFDVPVCYGEEFGPDLQEVAAFAGCSEEEVIAIHEAATYRVYMVGFVPGFAYMAVVDDKIAAPRRPTPRSAIPAGSVAIAGRQTGIYPSVTPGGWNLIGRTPIKPFDMSRAEPVLLRAGDAVRFKRISRREYDHSR